MYSLDELKQQNRDIAELCQVLEVLTDKYELRGNSYLCDLISTFYDKVWMHLMFEDKSLYTDLLTSHNADTVAAANNFHDSAKALKKRFGGHIKKWCHHDASKEEYGEFTRQMHDVIASVMERVKVENEEIFPLVERTCNNC